MRNNPLKDLSTGKEYTEIQLNDREDGNHDVATIQYIVNGKKEQINVFGEGKIRIESRSYK